VTIPKLKGFILLEGDGSWNTDINFDDHAHADMNDLMRDGGGRNWSPTALSATFTVLADNFVARNIAFKNMYSAFDKNRRDQAVAALVGGDRSAFYGCAFYGFQDTLCDFLGRHYFRDCYIKGGIDFIFGYGQSIYEGCTLFSDVPESFGHQPGWVTAHAKENAGSPGGLVFKGGEIQGSGRLYLGRAWNQYATVVFYHVNMTGVVVPQGWDAWNSTPDV
jgi:pectinesterase